MMSKRRRSVAELVEHPPSWGFVGEGEAVLPVATVQAISYFTESLGTTVWQRRLVHD